MEAILTFLEQQPWWALVSAVIASASLIAAATPTPAAGSVMAKAYAVLDFLALNFGKAKDK